jgi:hypothetical protein
MIKTTFLILILILVLARFTLKGLFNRKWREQCQDIVDNIRNEKTFWSLLDGFNSMEFDPRGVLFLYLISLTREITNRDALLYRVSGRKPMLKNLIQKKNDAQTNLESLRKALAERDAFIKKHLSANEVVFSDTEISDSYRLIDDDLSTKDVPGPYHQFIRERFDSIIQGEITGLSIWIILKEIERKESEFQYDKTGTKMINARASLALLTAQTFLYDTVSDLLSKRLEDENDFPRFQKVLAEWRQLHILQWFINTQSNWQKDLKDSELMMWRVIAAII